MGALISAGDVTGIGAAATGVADITSTIGNFIERFIPDKGKQAEASQALSLLLVKQSGDENTGQIETNKIEAASSNWFVAGWRPAIGWVCALGSLYGFIIQPVWQSILTSMHSVAALPVLNSEQLTALTTGMLGLGAMHSWDKLNGTAAPLNPVQTTKATNFRTNKK